MKPKNFVVVSYDSDEQQWFYDTVLAATEEDAAAVICRIRPYVTDADAMSPAQLRVMGNHASKRSPKQVRKALTDIAFESGVITGDEDSLDAILSQA